MPACEWWQDFIDTPHMRRRQHENAECSRPFTSVHVCEKFDNQSPREYDRKDTEGADWCLKISSAFIMRKEKDSTYG